MSVSSKRANSIINLGFWWLLICTPVQASDSSSLSVDDLSLKGIFTHIEATNPGLLKQRALWDAEKKRVSQARADLLPQISVERRVGRTYEDNHIESFAETDPETDARERSISERKDSYKDNQLRLTGSLSLLDASIWTNLDAVSSEAREAALEYQQTAQQLLSDFLTNYFSLLRARKLLRITEAELRSTSELAKLSESRFAEDLGNRIDVLDAEARARQLEADQLEAENQVETFQAELEKIIGVRLPFFHRLAETELEVNSISGKEWLRAALNNSPVLRLRHQQVSTALHQLRNTRAGHFPSLSFDASIIEENTDLSDVSQGTDNQTKELALVLNIPIYSGGRVFAQRQEREHRYRAATYAVDDELRALKESIHTAWQQLITQKQRLRVLNAALKSAKEAQSLHRHAQQEGLESQLDTLASERTLYTIERSLARARFDALLNQIELERLSGRIGDDLLIYLDELLVNAGTMNEIKAE